MRVLTYLYILYEFFFFTNFCILNLDHWLIQKPDRYLDVNTIHQALINPLRMQFHRGYFWDCACVAGLVESSFSWSISSQTIPSHINKNVSEIMNQKWSSVYQVENQLTVSMLMLFKVTPTTHLWIGWTTRASRHRNPFSCVSGAS